MNIKREPIEPKNQLPLTDTLWNIYEEAGRVLAGKRETLYPGMMPLCGLDEMSQHQQEVLDNIFVIGSTVLGLSRIFSDQGKDVTHVRLSVLPIGEKAGVVGEDQSSATIFDIDVASLLRPRGDGTIQGWQKYAIGRGDISGLTGVLDDAISREHLEITVTADGRVEILDHSTNGTVIVSGDDLMRGASVGGFSDSDRIAIAELIEPLEKHPHLWNAEYSGQRVINPY